MKTELTTRLKDLLTNVEIRKSVHIQEVKQRLGIADTLMKDPKSNHIDEPTLDLILEGINDMLGLIVELARKDKRTVLISSHLCIRSKRFRQ